MNIQQFGDGRNDFLNTKTMKEYSLNESLSLFGIKKL